MITASQKYIHPSSFILLENWSVQYLRESSFSYNEKFSLVRISNFLTRNKTAIDIENDKWYKRVTIKIKNGGVFIRDTQIGKKIGTKKQFLVRKGQFLLSKIDARNGAFGVVPEELDGAIITGNFWTFDVDYSKINPHFLSLITTTAEFLRFSENASNGTTNRHYLQEDLFLKVKIPLPSIEEQNKIVENYNLRITQSVQQEKEAVRLDNSIDEFIFSRLQIEYKKNLHKIETLNVFSYKGISVWGAERLLKGRDIKLLESREYENRLLSSVVFINPRTELSNLVGNSQMSFIPMECVSDDYGEVLELKQGFKENSGGYTKFKEGDLLWARITPCMENGKSAIVYGLQSGYGYGSTEFHVIREKQPDVQIKYIYQLLRTKAVREEAINFFTGSAGQQRVPKVYLENLVIPIPPIWVQNEIVNTIDTIKHRIKELHGQAKLNRRFAIQEFENEIFKPCN